MVASPFAIVVILIKTFFWGYLYIKSPKKVFRQPHTMVSLLLSFPKPWNCQHCYFFKQFDTFCTRLGIYKTTRLGLPKSKWPKSLKNPILFTPKMKIFHHYNTFFWSKNAFLPNYSWFSVMFFEKNRQKFKKKFFFGLLTTF